MALSFALSSIACESSKRPRKNDDEGQIRAARELSNNAIAVRDTLALASVWTEDYHVITSRNAEASGRAANIARFKSEYSSKPDVIYVRTPARIDIFSKWSMAAESGTWIGRWTESGRPPDGQEERVVLQGRYFAKWHKTNGKWMIRAEIFVPLNCSGDEFCGRAPIW